VLIVKRESLHTLRGHTSTVRCLKMSDSSTAISGSRDTTLRIWDIKTGLCKNVLVGHQASVRCLEIKGDIVVSGSYDTTARVWSISEGRCLRTLSGHFSQIYAIAFDGTRIATGSLDTSVRIWDPNNGFVLSSDTEDSLTCSDPVKQSFKDTPRWLGNYRCVEILLSLVVRTVQCEYGRWRRWHRFIDSQHTTIASRVCNLTIPEL